MQNTSRSRTATLLGQKTRGHCRLGRARCAREMPGNPPFLPCLTQSLAPRKEQWSLGTCPCWLSSREGALPVSPLTPKPPRVSLVLGVPERCFPYAGRARVAQTWLLGTTLLLGFNWEGFF